jgi:hypothetical protein
LSAPVGIGGAEPAERQAGDGAAAVDFRVVRTGGKSSIEGAQRLLVATSMSRASALSAVSRECPVSD